MFAARLPPRRDVEDIQRGQVSPPSLNHLAVTGDFQRCSAPGFESLWRLIDAIKHGSCRQLTGLACPV
jgi:hypothetical protein